MGNDSTRLVPRISCSTTLITPPWLKTATVSSCSAPAATSSTAARTRARNASSSTELGRCPAAMRAHSCGFSSRMCSIGTYTGRSRSYSAKRSSISTVNPRAAATGSAVWIARRCGLLTTREIGNLASASGSRATCTRPSSERSGSARSCFVGPGSLRSGNACRTRSNCMRTALHALQSPCHLGGECYSPNGDWGVRMVDAGVLGRWLDANDAPGAGEEPILEQLSGGSQNTLYLIQRGDERMVLRMPGARADAARIDGLLREIRLVRALRGTDVPHAELIAANDAGDLLGMPFYVMRAIDGWSPMDGGWPAPFDTDLTARRGLAFELVDGAAKLGRVDWRAQGLDGFGRPDGFHERQVDRWLAFLDSYRVRDLPGLDEAADWLRRNRPAHYTPGIMHGDYQFANMMFAHGEPARLAAIVDWEMTTVGDPLLDVAWALLGYDGENPRDDGFYLDMHGMPTRSELLERYEKVSGLSTENIDYYLVLANWKLGIVLEKTYAAGVRSGKVDPKIQGAFGAMVPQLIATAAEMARSLPTMKPLK